MSNIKEIIAKSKMFVVGGIVVLILVLLPLVENIGNNYILTLLFTVFIFVILSQSWNLMGGYAGQFNLGLAAYFGSGALSCSLLISVGLSSYVAILAGGLLAAALGCIVGIPTLRLHGIYFAIGTLAIAEALRITVANIFPGWSLVPSTYWETYSIIERYYICLALVVITIIIVYSMVNSQVGLALKAIRDDEDAAKATGINPAKYKILVFIISSFLAGLAGGVFCYFRGSISPYHQFSVDWTFGPLMAACIGGLGTITGPILGSIIFVLLQELLSQTVGKAYFIVTGVLFILVILFLPGGLVRSRESLRRFLAGLISRKSESNTSLF